MLGAVLSSYCATPAFTERGAPRQSRGVRLAYRRAVWVSRLRNKATDGVEELGGREADVEGSGVINAKRGPSIAPPGEPRMQYRESLPFDKLCRLLRGTVEDAQPAEHTVTANGGQVAVWAHSGGLNGREAATCGSLLTRCQPTHLPPPPHSITKLLLCGTHSDRRIVESPTAPLPSTHIT